jgi:DNA-binding response OmpR family regulator
LQVGDLTFNTGTLKVLRGERNIVLPPIALKFLEVLMRNSPRVLSREEVERAIWGDTPPDSDALRGHLHILRNVVEKNAVKTLIKTHRGLGYQISDE